MSKFNDHNAYEKAAAGVYGHHIVDSSTDVGDQLYWGLKVLEDAVISYKSLNILDNEEDVVTSLELSKEDGTVFGFLKN